MEIKENAEREVSKAKRDLKEKEERKENTEREDIRV